MLLGPVRFYQDYPMKNGRPTSKGIERYVKDNTGTLIQEYEAFIGEELTDVMIYADDLVYYGMEDSLELGRYYPDEIIISTAELYWAYEVAHLPKNLRNRILENNRFVKAVVFHELTHDYVYQISQEMHEEDNIRVHDAYRTHIWIIRNYEKFGSKFIEEGICEYVTEKMGEIITPEKCYVPETIEDLLNRDNKYKVLYKYSSRYLETFLDTTGLKKGIKTLLYNPPPNFEEILHPELYFSRLESPERF